MARQTSYLLHARILPHDDLVLAVSMRADQFITVLAPRQIAHLTSSVDFLDHLPLSRIPEFDAAVGRPAARRQKGVLVRRPRDRFYGSGVLAKFPERGFIQLVPDHEFVIVPPRGELPVLGVPVQAADFLLMPDEFAEVLLRLADVAVVDEAVAAAGGEDVVVPGEGADPGGVARHGAEAALFVGVPDLDEAFVGADCDVRAALDPGDGCDDVVLEVAELVHFAGMGVPHVDAGAKADPQDVAAAPVDEVEVEVVG